LVKKPEVQVVLVKKKPGQDEEDSAAVGETANNVEYTTTGRKEWAFMVYWQWWNELFINE
jgi:hypothetical protein